MVFIQVVLIMVSVPKSPALILVMVGMFMVLDVVIVLFYSMQRASDKPLQVVMPIYPRAGEVTINNRVYPPDVMEKAVKEYKETLVDKGRAVGTLGIEESPTIALHKAAFIVDDIIKINDMDAAKIHTLRNTNGRILKGLLKDPSVLKNFSVKMSGIGRMEEKDGVQVIQDDYRITSFGVTQKDT